MSQKYQKTLDCRIKIGPDELNISIFFKLPPAAIQSLVRPLAKREYEGRASFLENHFLPLFHTKT
jgi:hypothetical protein